MSYRKCKQMKDISTAAKDRMSDYMGRYKNSVDPNVYFSVPGDCSDTTPKKAKLCVRSVAIQKHDSNGRVSGIRVEQMSGLLTPAGVFYVSAYDFGRRSSD
jgi:hypothetical protein